MKTLRELFHFRHKKPNSANYNVIDTGHTEGEALIIAHEKYLKNTQGIISRGVVAEDRKEQVAHEQKPLDKRSHLNDKDFA